MYIYLQKKVFNDLIFNISYLNLAIVLTILPISTLFFKNITGALVL